MKNRSVKIKVTLTLQLTAPLLRQSWTSQKNWANCSTCPWSPATERRQGEFHYPTGDRDNLTASDNTRTS